jgi:hypothetical protein
MLKVNSINSNRRLSTANCIVLVEEMSLERPHTVATLKTSQSIGID